MHSYVFPAVMAALLIAAPAAAQQNISAFREAPVTRLNGAELKEFWAFIGKTLDEGKEGATVEWKAPQTTFTSKVTPGRSFDEGKLKCREATIESDSRDRFQRGIYTLCKGGKGGWQFKSPAGKGTAGKS